MLGLLGRIVVVLLVGAAAFELAVALGAGSIGSDPGQDVTGQDLAATVAGLAMFGGVVLALVYVWRPQAVVALFAPAAAAYMLAFYYTYDPYYAPQQQRYSEGAMSLGPILIVVALAVGVALLARRRPREGAALTSVMLLVILVTTALAGDGH